MSDQKAFLFLQGPSSPLFAKIAEHLTRAGHACYRINLNVGDQIFWRRGGASNYRGSLEKWRAYIRSFIDDRRIGTIILLGEERPYHKEAVQAAKERGVEVVVIEMGYLRPDWVTVELDGMSSNSRFPNDPDVIMRAAADLPEPDWTRKYSQTFLNEALADLAYYLPSVFLGLLYPRYRFHGLFHPLAEYAGWVGRLATARHREKEARVLTESLQSGGAPWFVYPLQLETDYQLRAHSPYKSQRDAIAHVISSFAHAADGSARLAIKVHPLDNGLISWSRVIQSAAEKFGVDERVFYFDGGDFNALMTGCRGVVTVNSTAALSALSQSIPTKTLGAALFDIEGLTNQGSLDEFWRSPIVPDPELRRAFFRLVAASIQERGNFYSTDGVAAAALSISSRMVEDRLNEPGGNAGCSPRPTPQKASTGGR
ncbi:putative capsule polysaccharide biosynthesis protein [Agrobacterium rubi TR3 = NBRC 13261]|uniref:Putative capsule polysaccharide biosynthesis protein n=1 Tax=Agrobacterium rubi TR3 = NBRC 13261 TaxID=1368415 RepID=A0A081CYY0_9HYPH|nr:capsular biosynthesis protein [Agrobacterium rubi]MBP1880187.1 capsular polysaccharide export protein [Agrobacterium rubi]GAK71876.1 putative capsule polysaccharide biosynthesis protein [Agrobacterium rubi TR3 = NBRC 13261]